MPKPRIGDHPFALAFHAIAKCGCTSNRFCSLTQPAKTHTGPVAREDLDECDARFSLPSYWAVLAQRPQLLKGTLSILHCLPQGLLGS